jgi:hypothetical protein
LICRQDDDGQERRCKPQEIADAVLWMTADLGALSRARQFSVDGGQSL